MASSDLTLQALMAGGVPQNQDPALLGIMPKMKLAQAMLEEGTSMAPVASSKYGGLGKIAQALLGSYAMNSAQNDVADYAKQRQQNAIAANAFMSGNGSGQFMPPSSGGIIQGGTQAPPPAASPPPVTAQPSAPSSGGGEAANAGYGPKLAAQLGIGPDDKLDMTDPMVRARLVSAISNNEGRGPGVRSTRNNNPGNLEASDWTRKQPGYIGTDGRFAQFETPEHGEAAAHALLQNYGAQGLNTPNAIAAKWAPVPVPAAGGVASVAAPTAPGQGAAPTGLNSPMVPGAVASAGQPAANVPASVQTGLNSPMVQNAIGMIHRAQQMMIANPYDPQIQQMGHAKIAEAQMLMGLDTFAPGPNGTQVNTRTGEVKYPSTGRFSQDSAGNLIYAEPGQPIRIVSASDPEGAGRLKGAIAGAEAQAKLPSQIALALAEPRLVSPGQTLTSGLPHGTPGNGPPASVAFGMAGGNAPPPINAPNATPPINAATEPGSYVPGAVSDMYKHQHEMDVKNVQADIDKAKAGNKIYGTTATIRATLPEVTTGKLADPKQYAGQWASALGMSPENVLKYTGTKPVEGEILQKKLFELQTGAARELGAREPGSVIAMYRENYPNMSSQNMTINTMTRLLDMDQRHQADYANAKAKALDAARADYQTNGRHYNGLTDFDSKFHETNNPIVYTAAALLAAKMPHATWANGLSPDQQKQAVQLATTHWNDVKGFMHPNGQFYVPEGQQ